jgi:hypothetical protein
MVAPLHEYGLRSKADAALLLYWRRISALPDRPLSSTKFSAGTDIHLKRVQAEWHSMPGDNSPATEPRAVSL